MEITVERSDDSCCIKLAGELNIYTAMDSWEQLHAGVADASEIKVDLAAVSELDTSGVQLLMMLKKTALAEDTSLSLINHSNEVLEVMDLFNLSGYFGDPVLLSNKAQKS